MTPFRPEMGTLFILTMTLLTVPGTEPASDAQTPSKSKPVPASLSVQEMVVATDIERFKPIGVAERFPSTVGKLFCFTKIMGAKGETSVRHLWFYGDRLMSEVLLPVQRISWRTFSSRTIRPEWTGSWRVDITAEDGTLLKSVSFTIQ